MEYKTNKIIRVIHAIQKKWGNIYTKKSIWDTEFSSGQWDYLEDTREDFIYHYLEKFCNNGFILDLGCGSGNTGNEININKYQHYTGVDISEQAIQKAILRSKQNNRNDKNEYFIADILKYIPEKQYDIILFRESISYIPRYQVKGMLDRYSNFLKQNGVIIVRIYNRKKYRFIIKLIEKNYTIFEKCSASNTNAIIIIFK